jgi:hypothetical protein
MLASGPNRRIAVAGLFVRRCPWLLFDVRQVQAFIYAGFVGLLFRCEVRPLVPKPFHAPCVSWFGKLLTLQTSSGVKATGWAMPFSNPTSTWISIQKRSFVNLFGLRIFRVGRSAATLVGSRCVYEGLHHAALREIFAPHGEDVLGRDTDRHDPLVRPQRSRQIQHCDLVARGVASKYQGIAVARRSYPILRVFILWVALAVPSRFELGTQYGVHLTGRKAPATCLGSVRCVSRLHLGTANQMLIVVERIFWPRLLFFARRSNRSNGGFLRRQKPVFHTFGIFCAEQETLRDVLAWRNPERNYDISAAYQC